jgi:hypothetical protein
MPGPTKHSVAVMIFRGDQVLAIRRLPSPRLYIIGIYARFILWPTPLILTILMKRHRLS